MKKEESLIIKKEGVFSKILAKIKMFIYKNSKKDTIKEGKLNVNSIKSKSKTAMETNEQVHKVDALEDMEILKKIVRNEIQVEDLDDETKIRLIILCKNREADIKKRIEETKKQIQVADNLIKKCKKEK